MGERRMFCKSVMYGSSLSELPHSTQVLYLYLNLEADDDGFVTNPRIAMCMARCRKQQLEALLLAGYLIRFDSGVIVIAHWRVHNQLRSDRYKPSNHKKERSMLRVTPAGLYTIEGEGDALCADGCQLVSKSVTVLDTQDKISKDKLSKEKISKEKISKEKISKEKISKDKTDEDKGAEPMPASAGEESSSESSVSSYYERSVLDIYKQCCPSLLRFDHLSQDLRESIGKLRENGWTLSQIENAFRRAEQTPYLKGSGKDGWTAGLAWLCKEDNLQKVAEGRYQVFEKPAPRPAPKNSIWGSGEPGRVELEEIRRLLAED